MLTSEQRGHPSSPAAAHSSQGAAAALPGGARATLHGVPTHLQRLVLAFTASLAFYAIFPWLDLLPKLLAETIMLGFWSVPGLFFLAALYPSPLLQQLSGRFSFLRVTFITGIALACSLVSLFLVIGIMVAINALLGIPLKAS